MEIFLQNALDDPNQIELLQQITLRAQPPRRKESADCRSPGREPVNSAGRRTSAFARIPDSSRMFRPF
jgi:hypothetical protein